MTDTGIVSPPELQDVSIDKFSRRSFNVGNYVANSYNVSTWVSAHGPVVCERSMYGYGHAWAHNSIGYMLGFGTLTAAAPGETVEFKAAGFPGNFADFPCSCTNKSIG